METFLVPLQTTLIVVIITFVSIAVIGVDASGLVEPVVARNFKGTLKRFDASLVEFYAPWCGHCKALEPKLDAVASRLAEEHSKVKAAIFKVDAVAQQALAAKYSIQSYPTIKLFYGNNEIEKYEGDRETENLLSYIVDKALAAPTAPVDTKRATKNRRQASRPSSTRTSMTVNVNGDVSSNRHGKQKKNTQAQAQAHKKHASGEVRKSDNKLTKQEQEALWREEIGRSTWHLLHSVAAKYPDNPTEEEMKAAKEFVHSLQILYPCELCRHHLNEKMGTSEPLVFSRKAFSSWACMLHNLVNDDLGKEHFDCTLKHLDNVYRKNCDGCVVNGTVEDLSSNAVEFGSTISEAQDANNDITNSRNEQRTQVNKYSQTGSCTIDDAHTHYWLDADTVKRSSQLTDGKLTILFFYSVTCHVCHEIHPLLKILHEEYADRGLNIIAVHQTIYGDIDTKFENQAIDYHVLEELPYPILSHQQTANNGESDRIALPNSLFTMSMGRDGFGVPAMAVMKDCNTVWRGMGFQLKNIDSWIRGNADKYLA